MKRSAALFLALLALRAAPLRAADLPRVPAAAHPIRSVPYPPRAAAQQIEGNVVLTGTVTAKGEVAALRPLASSSPALTAAAIDFVSQWKFTPATEGGKPIPLTLNAVVRFRKDARGKPSTGLDPGTMQAPMVGNLVLSPGGPQGQSKSLEGFPVESQDASVTGTIDLDLPKASPSKPYRMVVTDVFPSGRRVTLLDRPVSGGGTEGAYAATVTFHRLIRAGDPSEKGEHLVSVQIDGREAGGGIYTVAGTAPAAARPKRAKRK